MKNNKRPRSNNNSKNNGGGEGNTPSNKSPNSSEKIISNKSNLSKKRESGGSAISPNWLALKKQIAPSSNKSKEIKLKRKNEEKKEFSEKTEKKPKIDPKLYEITKHLALDCEMVGIGKDNKDSLASKKKKKKN